MTQYTPIPSTSAIAITERSLVPPDEAALEYALKVERARRSSTLRGALTAVPFAIVATTAASIIAGVPILSPWMLFVIAAGLVIGTSLFAVSFAFLTLISKPIVYRQYLRRARSLQITDGASVAIWNTATEHIDSETRLLLSKKYAQNS